MKTKYTPTQFAQVYYHNSNYFQYHITGDFLDKSEHSKVKSAKRYRE